MTMRSVPELIAVKRDGGSLSEAEIRHLIEGFTAGEVADERHLDDGDDLARSLALAPARDPTLDLIARADSRNAVPPWTDGRTPFGLPTRRVNAVGVVQSEHRGW